MKKLSQPTVLYVLAFLLLALAAVGSHLVFVKSLSALDEDSIVINTSGRQRMLSEQTFRLVGELIASENAGDTQILKDRLKASLGLMRQSHVQLASDVDRLQVSSPGSTELKAAYFGGDASLDARLRAYFAALDTLLETPPEGLSFEQEAYRSIAQTHRDGLVADLDEVVQIYEGIAQANLEAAERLHVYLMLGMLALLLLEALFVFRPLIRRQVQANQELLEARDEARAELGARTNILATVSHEIRTPLGGVLGIIDQLKREPSPIERERALNLVEDSCEVLLETLDAILRQSRLGHGAEELSETTFNPAGIANRVAELFRPAARRKALRIDVNATTNREARGDDARIQQVLANLVSNAVKFTQSGAITIFVQEPAEGSQEWSFVVSDTGAGMDEKRIEGLFEPFGHSSDDTLGRAGGAGLGLAITRDLVEAMGGRVEVESERGKGSSFTVLIPLRHPPQETDTPGQTSQNGYVALLIDRASDRVQAEAVAAQAGFTVLDLNDNADPDLPPGFRMTLIVDEALLSQIGADLVEGSERIIVLGDGRSSEAMLKSNKAVAVSHNQLARSLSEILKGETL